MNSALLMRYKTFMERQEQRGEEGVGREWVVVGRQNLGLAIACIGATTVGRFDVCRSKAFLAG